MSAESNDGWLVDGIKLLAVGTVVFFGCKALYEAGEKTAVQIENVPTPVPTNPSLTHIGGAALMIKGCDGKDLQIEPYKADQYTDWKPGTKCLSFSPQEVKDSFTSLPGIDPKVASAIDRIFQKIVLVPSQGDVEKIGGIASADGGYQEGLSGEKSTGIIVVNENPSPKETPKSVLLHETIHGVWSSNSQDFDNSIHQIEGSSIFYAYDSEKNLILMVPTSLSTAEYNSIMDEEINETNITSLLNKINPDKNDVKGFLVFNKTYFQEILATIFEDPGTRNGYMGAWSPSSNIVSQIEYVRKYFSENPKEKAELINAIYYHKTYEIVRKFGMASYGEGDLNNGIDALLFLSLNMSVNVNSCQSMGGPAAYIPAVDGNLNLKPGTSIAQRKEASPFFKATHLSACFK